MHRLRFAFRLREDEVGSLHFSCCPNPRQQNHARDAHLKKYMYPWYIGAHRSVLQLCVFLERGQTDCRKSKCLTLHLRCYLIAYRPGAASELQPLFWKGIFTFQVMHSWTFFESRVSEEAGPRTTSQTDVFTLF